MDSGRIESDVAMLANACSLYYARNGDQCQHETAYRTCFQLVVGGQSEAVMRGLSDCMTQHLLRLRSESLGAWEVANSVVSSPCEQLTPAEPPSLNVGGTTFSLTPACLAALPPDSMLAALLSGRHTVARDAKGCVFVDRDPELFSTVLALLTDPCGFKVRRFFGMDADQLGLFLSELDYFGIPPPRVVPTGFLQRLTELWALHQEVVRAMTDIYNYYEKKAGKESIADIGAKAFNTCVLFHGQTRDLLLEAMLSLTQRLLHGTAEETDRTLLHSAVQMLSNPAAGGGMYEQIFEAPFLELMHAGFQIYQKFN
eukprot:gnl/Hemi2/3081_TR1086_c0_g1_i1.p1 gnl/Hemi2/3081_TR1086_c0_g1~~gnl/Hemi2/3081_TR1086_c0_g1_i1.p1  ORF type:complete len:313 (+),score=69.78 gnl/Hemi2/3081_TR1086_c0_g1_i1:101-1039(+)